MTIDTDELRRLAEAARDKRLIDFDLYGSHLQSVDAYALLKVLLPPAAVLALLDRLAAAEAALEAVVAGFADCTLDPLAFMPLWEAYSMAQRTLDALRQPPAATGGEGV